MATKTRILIPAPPKALSLHLGLNLVSAAAYEGWTGPLAACEFDANDMAAIARLKGMKPTVLLTKKATRAALLAGMRAAAKTLKSGDLFFLTYSGHGGQVRDSNRDEPDRKDETWCLYDGQLIDDELYFELSRFAAGVRILVLSDSCHSGTVTRERTPLTPPPGQRAKLMPDAVGERVYAKHKAFYDGLQADVAKAAKAAQATVDPDHALAQLAVTGAAAQAQALVGVFRPQVILISGCQDPPPSRAAHPPAPSPPHWLSCPPSMDGEHNGAFTEKLLRVWNQGAFAGGYASFHARIRAAMPASQSPNLFTLGLAAPFLAQRPFTL